MLDVVGDMSKESSARFQLVHIRERFINPEVCRVFPEAQAVQHQYIQALQRCDCRWWNLAEIRQVSKIVEPISHHRQATMNHFEGRDLEIFSDAETPSGRNNIRDYFGQTAAKMRWLKDVLENTFDIDPCAFVCVNAKRTETKVQRPDVVETKNVVCVTVCDENSVELFQTEAQSLLTKVCRRVDQDSTSRLFNYD